MDKKQEPPQESGVKGVGLGFWFFIVANIVMVLIIIYKVFCGK